MLLSRRQLVLVATAVAASAGSLATLCLKLWRRSFYDGLENIIGFSSKVIAAARAIETQRGDDALLHDPLAELLAGPDAMRQARERAAVEDAGVGNDGLGGGPQGATPRPRAVKWLIMRTVFCDDCVLTATGRQPGRTEGLRSAWALALQQAATAGACTQVCLLGAGMDTRAWRLDLPPGVAWFEVDQPDVLAAKKALLQRAGALFVNPARATEKQTPLRAASYTGVAADLQVAGWSQQLIDAGFSPSARTLWVLEGLLYYLAQDAVPPMLQEMARVCGPGSLVVATCVSRSVADERRAAARKTSARSARSEWKSGIPGLKPSWAEYFAPTGWAMTSAAHPTEIAKEYGLQLVMERKEAARTSAGGADLHSKAEAKSASDAAGAGAATGGAVGAAAAAAPGSSDVPTTLNTVGWVLAVRK